MDPHELRKQKFRMALKSSLEDMKKYGLKFGDKICDIIPNQEYQSPDSHAFFKAVRLEQIDKVHEMLCENKFLVHQFDNVSLT